MRDLPRHFIRLAPLLALAYLAVLAVILLRPFAFSAPGGPAANTAAWLPNGAGVRFGPSGMLVSALPPTALLEKLRSARGMTVEIWLRAALARQLGPARIVSYSRNPWESNFTLGQQRTELVVRLRTAETDANGTPDVDLPRVFAPGRWQHITITTDVGQLRIYIDGALRREAPIGQPVFETWDPSALLVFGNEPTGGRAWDGAIAYAAIYDRPLPASVIAARHAAGPRRPGRPETPGRILAYDFTRGPAGLQAATANKPRLERPAEVATNARLFLSFLQGRMIHAESTTWDLLRNVILFVPFGALLFAALDARMTSAGRTAAATFAVAALVSAGFEVLQYFVGYRTSSLFDVGTNALGGLVGAIGCWACLRLYRAWPIPAKGRS